MRVRHFQFRHDYDKDTYGLSPLWMPSGQQDPMRGTGVAHDVLEHGNHDPVEFPGLGGAVYVRAIPGWWARQRFGNGDPVQNIAAEWIELYHLWQGESIPYIRTLRPLDEPQAEDMIHHIVVQGCKEIARNLEDGDSRTCIARWINGEQRRRMVNWMRAGYRACELRFREASMYALCDCFVEISQAADRFIDDHPECDDAHATLHFDVQGCRAHFTLENI